ncbi:MAG: hypothetical protein JXB45_03265 [Candidatus Krumholzibacteriota bacterium]|nr:hypothetical protein [Candidatus Krumholzibacteriota bacterium]
MILFLSILLKYKKTVIIFTAVGFVLSAAVSLIIPPRYKAAAVFMPSGVEEELTGERNVFKSIGSLGETYATLIRIQRNFIIDHIIRSRQMSRLMSARFNLRERYGVDTEEEVRRELQKRISTFVRDEGVVDISVEDRDPVRARDMVNGYLELVDSLLVELARENAVSRKRFLEEESRRREADIERLDSLLADFMREHHLYSVEIQTRALFAVMARLTSRRSALEIEKRLQELSTREGSLELEKLEFELEAIEKQLEAFLEENRDADLFPSLRQLPGLSARYLRMNAHRMMQEFALAFIRIKLEDAAISAQNRVTVIRVLDPPVIPEIRIWPRRKQIVLISTFSLLFWSCFVLLVREEVREGRFSLGISPAGRPGKGTRKEGA